MGPDGIVSSKNKKPRPLTSYIYALILKESTLSISPYGMFPAAKTRNPDV
jgi:hypothetical protein